MSNFSTITQLFGQPWVWVLVAGIILWNMGRFVWKVATWKATTDHRLSSLEKVIPEVYVMLDRILTLLISPKPGHPVAESSSPSKLNEYGRELSEKIKAKKVAAAYVDKMHEETQNMNAYQVQQHCFLFSMIKMLDDLEKNDKEIFDRISAVAYEDGLEIERLMRVIGFELRDQVLAMKGKTHAEVDEHALAD